MQRQCIVPECGNPFLARGFCRTHYNFLHHRKLLSPHPTPIERFLASFSIEETGCWLWQGTLDTGEYGLFFAEKIYFGAHRWSYEWFIGPIPDGLTIDHLCRVHRCVNPDHLEPVTHRENCLRGIAPAAQNAHKTHCKYGHEFTPKNTRPRPEGGRTCRECHRIKSAQRYALRMERVII